MRNPHLSKITSHGLKQNKRIAQVIFHWPQQPVTCCYVFGNRSYYLQSFTISSKFVLNTFLGTNYQKLFSSSKLIQSSITSLDKDVSLIWRFEMPFIMINQMWGIRLKNKLHNKVSFQCIYRNINTGWSRDQIPWSPSDTGISNVWRQY
jgi:hypothetical protein